MAGERLRVRPERAAMDARVAERPGAAAEQQAAGAGPVAATGAVVPHAGPAHR